MSVIPEYCKKVSFIDEKFADEYITKLHKTSKRKLVPVRAYLCEKCLTWHLTSIKSSEPRVKEVIVEKIIKVNKPDQKLLDKHSMICQKYKNTREELELLKVCLSIICVL